MMKWIIGGVLLLFFLALLRLRFTRYSFRREKAKCESPIEERMMDALYARGMEPYTQVPCGRYRIDIVVVKGRQKIAVECDGKAYHSSKEQVKRDQKRDRYLRKKKYTVVRFTGSEIYRNSFGCADKVAYLLK